MDDLVFWLVTIDRRTGAATTAGPFSGAETQERARAFRKAADPNLELAHVPVFPADITPKES